MPSLPARRGLLGTVVAGAVSTASGWLAPLRNADSATDSDALGVTVRNDHALSHEVSVRVGSGESAVAASASVDGTTSRDLASVLPEVSDAGESGAERYKVAVAVDGRRRASTTVSQDVDSISVRIDVIGTVEIERTAYAG
ncbi:hypothetical protein [Salinirubrum litoreum]|uniref:Tat (Twin-arginine translocation) pathway signal sequence n=1 Tax=Salinirubrum litoreum TaxID=1126234 RepID=A0ABD5R9S6_9EURY|nr:hypothetical protein [Salinirubrum litoreum]